MLPQSRLRTTESSEGTFVTCLFMTSLVFIKYQLASPILSKARWNTSDAVSGGQKVFT